MEPEKYTEMKYSLRSNSSSEWSVYLPEIPTKDDIVKIEKVLEIAYLKKDNRNWSETEIKVVY